MRSVFRLSRRWALPALFLLLTPAVSLAQAAATTTTLVVSPASPVTAGTMLTLTATIASSGSPVLRGTVTFYDGTAALGTVQTVSTSSGGYTPGTATLKTRSLSIGSHSLTAKFNATTTDASSASTVQSVTVNGPSPTVSALAATTNSATNYSLSSTFTGLGATSPTGNVTFADTTTSTTLGTSALTAVAAGQLNISTILNGTTCPQVIAVADMNGDGINDLVIGNGTNCGPSQSPASVSILLGNGDGTFQPAITTQIPSYSPTSIAVADLNGDGIPDLVAAAGVNNTFYVLLGNGDGTFQTPVPYSLNYDVNTENLQDAYLVITGDFNGDGIPDVLAIMEPDELQENIYGYNAGPAPPSAVYLALGNGDGTFQTPVLLNLGLGPIPAALAADVNGDGHLDLIVSEGSTIVVLLGNGNGTFQAPQSITTGSQNFASMSIGDLTGDGIPDLVASDTNAATSTDPSAPSIYVFKGKGDGTFTQTYTATTPDPFQSIALLDFNHDGHLDVAAVSSSDLCILLGNGDGTLSASPQCTAIPVGVTAQLVTGDLRGFGPGDIALAESGPGYPAFSSAFVASGTLASASASLSSITATSGDKVVANYAGDTNFAAGTSNTVTLGSLLPVSVTLSLSPSYPAVGQNLTLTATVSSTGSTSPTGAIQFYYNTPGPGGIAIGSPITINGNTAAYTFNPVTQAGNVSYSAAYSGDLMHAAADSQLTNTLISQGYVTLTAPVLSPSATVLSGTPVTITSQLTAPFPTPAPTGSVSLYDEAGNTSAASQVLSGSTPIALSFTLNTAANPLPPQSYTLELSYSGDSNWEATHIYAGTALIVQGTTTTSISYTGPSSVQAGTPITITGQFTVSANPSGVATEGIVALLDNGTVIDSSGTVIAGSTVSFTINTAAEPLAPGNHSFTLEYQGQGNPLWQSSTSSSIPVNVQSISLSLSNPSPSVAPGGSITETINVSSLGGLNDSTTFACSGLPQGAACTFNPTSVTGTGSTTLTLTTTGSTAALTPERPWLPGSGAALACVFLLLLPNRKRKWAQLLGIVMLCIVFTANGCAGGGSSSSSSGGSGSGGGGGGSSSATPAGTYTIKVTTTTGTGASAISHAVTFKLTVT